MRGIAAGSDRGGGRRGRASARQSHSSDRTTLHSRPEIAIFDGGVNGAVTTRCTSLSRNPTCHVYTPHPPSQKRAWQVQAPSSFARNANLPRRLAA
eukprot:2758522-Rhodomonas_salina.1